MKAIARVSDDDLLQVIQKTKLFSVCDPTDLINLLPYFVVKKIGKKVSVFDKGDMPDGLYVAITGSLEVIRTSSEGKEIVFNILRPGDAFGEIAIFDDLERTAMVRSLEPCQLAFLSREKFKTVSHNLSSSFWIEATKLLCDLLRRKTDYIEGVHFLSAKQRLAVKILDLAAQSGNNQITLSQEKIAHMIGLTREMTNKSLSSLHDEKLISVSHSQIIVLDLQQLKILGGKQCE